MAVDHSGHRERMKERAMREGLQGFAPHEFLEFLLYPFIPYKDTNAIAHELLDEFGSLEAVFDVGYENLIKIKGMTKSASLYFSLMPEIFRKYGVSKLDKKPMMDTIEKIVGYLNPLLSTLTKESVYMLSLDVKGRLLGSKCVSTGVVNEAYLFVRDIVEEALKRNASNVVVAHNHPSGNPKPSAHDMEMTACIKLALDSIGINFWDHVIIAKDTYYSFNRHGGFEIIDNEYL